MNPVEWIGEHGAAAAVGAVTAAAAWFGLGFRTGGKISDLKREMEARASGIRGEITATNQALQAFTQKFAEHIEQDRLADRERTGRERDRDLMVAAMARDLNQLIGEFRQHGRRADEGDA